MKRYLVILMCLGLVCSLIGCSKPQEPSIPETVPATSDAPTLQTSVPTEPDQTIPTATEPVETTVPETTAPVITDPVTPTYDIPLTAISMFRETELETDDQNKVLFTYTYPNVTFLHDDTDVARTALLDLRNRIEHYRAEAETLKTQASSIYAASGTAPNYSMTLSCDPKRVDQSILSLLLIQDVYSDSNQGTASIQAVTYDLITGNPLTLSALLAEDASMDSLQTMVTNALGETPGLYSWYDEILMELFHGNTLPENWYLSADGLCFYFMPYEIAPYSCGIVTAQIPYDMLVGLIRDRYYPPESVRTNGTLQVDSFYMANLSRFSVFAELILDEDGKSLLLSPTDVITAFSIRNVIYSSESGTYLPTDTVFATDTLTPSHAIRLMFNFDDPMSTLQISYESAGQQHIRYFQVNSEDGSISLSK